MAMNDSPTPIRGLVGPSGQPLEMASNWECPSCKHRPPLATMPNLPPGTPQCMITAQPGDLQPEFNCAMCWNKFWAKFIRRHAPALRPIADGVQFEEVDPDEEVE